MRTDYHIHYWGYQSRDAPVTEKMAVILAEIITPSTALKGYSELLGKRILEYGHVSSRLDEFQRELFNTSSQILEIRSEKKGGPKTEDSFNQFVARITPIIDELTTLVEEIDSINAELVKVYPEIPDLGELFLKHAHHIWATVDSIANPTLILPDYITDWLDNRDELWNRVYNGDLEVIVVLKKALENPIGQIRDEARAMLKILNYAT